MFCAACQGKGQGTLGPLARNGASSFVEQGATSNKAHAYLHSAMSDMSLPTSMLRQAG
jgi:hypothetical protein